MGRSSAVDGLNARRRPDFSDYRRLSGAFAASGGVAPSDTRFSWSLSDEP
jgi:hypothetical protein